MKFFQFHLFCLVSMALENDIFQKCTMYQEILVSSNTFLSVWKYDFYRYVITRLGKTEHETILWPNSFVLKSRELIDFKQHLIRVFITPRKHNTVRENKTPQKIKENYANFKQVKWRDFFTEKQYYSVLKSSAELSKKGALCLRAKPITPFKSIQIKKIFLDLKSLI